MFPDSNIVRAFKYSRTKENAMVKVVVIKEIIEKISGFKLFSIQIDETTDITVYQQMRYFNNTTGKMCCIFYKLEPVEKADAESIFAAIDKNFSESSAICYTNLVGLGSDGCNVMLGLRKSVMTCLKTKQPSLISFHCNCHVAALIDNHACGKLPGYLLYRSGIIFTKVLRGKGHLNTITSLLNVNYTSFLKPHRQDGLA